MHLVELLTLPTATLCLGSAAAGVLSHIGYFIRSEHHMEAPYLLVLAFILPPIMVVAQLQLTDLGLLQSLIRTTVVATSYLSALYASMVAYRLIFHPLRRFPGPLGYKISKIWHVACLAPKLDNFRQLDELHKQYGDFVRTGKFLHMLTFVLLFLFYCAWFRLTLET